MSLNTDLTYKQVRQAIAANLNRSDLDTDPLSDSSVIHQFFKRGVLYYNREFFYNAQFVDTSKSTSIGQAWVDLPEGWQDVAMIRYLQGGANWLPITRIYDYRDILALDTLYSPSQGPPSQYALFQNPASGKMAARFYTVPDQVYPLEFTMDKPPDAPNDDDAVSFWTTDAQSLMINWVCEMICRERLNRPLKANEHKAIREAEEISLHSKSIRISGGLRTKPYL